MWLQTCMTFVTWNTKGVIIKNVRAALFPHMKNHCHDCHQGLFLAHEYYSLHNVKLAQ